MMVSDTPLASRDVKNWSSAALACSTDLVVELTPIKMAFKAALATAPSSKVAFLAESAAAA